MRDDGVGVRVRARARVRVKRRYISKLVRL
jgi:hypothetical protein